MREILGGLHGKPGRLWQHRASPPREASHSHDEPELNLVARGAVTYMIDGRRHVLGRDSLLWLNHPREHLLLHASPDTRMWIAVLCPGALACLPRRLARDLVLGPPADGIHRRLAPGAARWLHQLANQLAPLCAPARRPDPDGLAAGLAFFAASAWEAFAAADPASGGPGAPMHPAVSALIRLLDAGDERPLGLLARVAGLDRATLSRRFRHDTGLTIADYRTRCRLERFTALAATRRTLLEAALAAGFGSYAQFHRVFTRHHGCSPRTACTGVLPG
jgi:AraC-like DNA-binding protein